MKKLLACLFTVCMWCLHVGSAHAVIAAQQGYTYGMGGAGYGYPSAEAVANQFGGVRGFSGLTISAFNNNTACATWSSPVVGCQTIFRSPSGLTCPANSTLSGVNCVCNSPTVESGAACIDLIAAACSALSGQVAFASVPGSASPGGSACSPTGCSVTFVGTVIRVKEGGVTTTKGDASFTGTTCTATPETTATPDPCPDGTTGEVNGVTRCVPYDPTLNVIESVNPVDSTTTTTDGTTTTTTPTTGTKTTVCEGTQCTTTTTTTTGGTTTTKTDKEDRASFCTENPRSPLCVERSISSSCGSFSCKGDAIDCEIARKAQEAACKLFDNITTVAGVGTAAANSTYEPSEAETTSLSFASAIDRTDRLASACPGDQVVQVASASITLPFSKLCGSLQMLGNLAVGISLLAAAFIVFKGN